MIPIEAKSLAVVAVVDMTATGGGRAPPEGLGEAISREDLPHGVALMAARLTEDTGDRDTSDSIWW